MPPPTTARVEYVLTGQEGTVHRSRSNLRCTQCGTTIPQGAYFTRRALPITGTVCVICDRCRPFRHVELPPDVEALASLS